MNPHKVLITGASRGIGKAISERFSKEGFQLITPSREELDLSSPNSVSSYMEFIDKDIDVIVNNAGVNILGSIDSFLDTDLKETLQVNLISAMTIIKGLIPGMRAEKFGRIVNISSIWSEVAKPGRMVYSVSKSAVNALTRNLAIELASDNILVNAVAPGFVNTDLTKKNNSPTSLEIIKNDIPLKRLAEPCEIAELVFFLCSEKNTYITGQTIIIDGGYTCQ
jgi:3-oxoacyl-[acyl-carrier protein] reductase